MICVFNLNQDIELMALSQRNLVWGSLKQLMSESLCYDWTKELRSESACHTLNVNWI